MTDKYKEASAIIEKTIIALRDIPVKSLVFAVTEKDGEGKSQLSALLRCDSEFLWNSLFEILDHLLNNKQTKSAAEAAVRMALLKNSSPVKSGSMPGDILSGMDISSIMKDFIKSEFKKPEEKSTPEKDLCSCAVCVIDRVLSKVA